MCVKQVGMLLDQAKDVPFKVISYLCGDINYGGRVTDKNDQRLLRSILAVYVNPLALTEGYKFSDSGLYRTIKPGTRQDYLAYIDSLPLSPQPEVFGLHDNANIIYMENETRLMLANLQKYPTLLPILGSNPRTPRATTAPTTPSSSRPSPSSRASCPPCSTSTPSTPATPPSTRRA